MVATCTQSFGIQATTVGYQEEEWCAHIWMLYKSDKLRSSVNFQEPGSVLHSVMQQESASC